MNKDLTVTQVTKNCNVTARMLRYYEKLGLIESKHKADYSYRVYDEASVGKIRMIVLFRKLKVPLKDIELILKSKSNDVMIQVLQKNISRLDDDVSSINTIRKALKIIENGCRAQESYKILEDSALLKITDTLTPVKNQIQEVVTMNEINKAEENLNKKLNVRIVKLPPSSVACAHYVGENCEEIVDPIMRNFIVKSKLYEAKSDAKMYGFNSPNPGVLPNDIHGYEIWVTIPDNFNVNVGVEGIEKKQMNGGLYAVTSIRFPDFHIWQELINWAESNEKYEIDWRGGQEVMGGLLEEHLNWVYTASTEGKDDLHDGQIDLLLPIKVRG